MIDDFEGEQVFVDKLSTERILEVRSKTIAAMTDPNEYSPPQRWEHQLDVIDEELEERGVAHD